MIYGPIGEESTVDYLIFINNPALILSIPTIMTGTVFDNLVDREMLEAGIGSQLLAMAGFAYAGRAGYHNIGLGSRRHGCEFEYILFGLGV